MNRVPQAIDLSSEEKKTTKKINSNSVTNEFRRNRKYMHHYQPGCFTYFQRFSKDEMFGAKRRENGQIEFDLEQPESPRPIRSSLYIKEQMTLEVSVEAEICEEGFIPVTLLNLVCEKKVDINDDTTVQIIARLYESTAKDSIIKQKFNLSLSRPQKIFEPLDKFEFSSSREFVLEVYVDASGFIKDEKTPNGIVNLGVTCYMNSYIQTIFHLKKFRYYINQLKTDSNHDFIFCLQSLFYSLEKGDVEAHTLDLVKAFGWNLEQMFMQQDVQEFSLKLLDAIEEKSKRQGVQHIVTKELFKGKLESYIKCVNVDFESKRGEDFYELQLNIKETNELTGSLDQLLQQETLFGDNAYDTEKMGKQDAIKGIAILELPDVLVFNVNRSDYNLETFEPVKLLSEFRFDQELDMKNYCVNGEVFSLFAVFVHIGFDSGRGHYTVFIKPNERWYEFNDEVVTQTDWESVAKQSYGGKNKDIIFDIKNFDIKERLKDSPSHAYMLVYVKKSKLSEVVNNCNQITPYPQGVADYTENKLRQMRKKRLRERNHKVFFTTEESFVGKPTGQGELFYTLSFKDPFNIKRFKDGPFDKEIISRDVKANELNDFVVKKYGKNAMVYLFNNKRKHLRLVKPSHNQPQFDANLFNQYAFVFMRKNEDFDLFNATLVIIKYFDAETEILKVEAVSLEDSSSTLQDVISRNVKNHEDEFLVYYEPNYFRKNLLLQDDLTIDLNEYLASKVRSEDVLTFILTSKTDQASRKLEALWTMMNDSVSINIWLEPEVCEDLTFNIHDPAVTILHCMSEKKLIGNPEEYTLTASMNDGQTALSYEDLTQYKVGNLICDDNTVSVSKTQKHIFQLYCNVQIINFKMKQLHTIHKNVEVNQENDFPVTLPQIEYILQNHPDFTETLQNNVDFFNTRYRKYNIVRYEYIVLTTDEHRSHFGERSIPASTINKVTLVPVISLENKSNSVGMEMQIKSDSNDFNNNAHVEDLIKINLFIASVEKIGLMQIVFTAEKKMTVDVLVESITKFVKRSQIKIELEEFEIEEGECANEEFVIRTSDPDDTLRSFKEYMGQKIETIAVDNIVRLFVIGVMRLRPTLEIELTP